MSDATISLCMIARDEAELIGQAISSVRTLVKEVILVDTGSTDRTPEIAAELGAKVLHRPWDDDFSAARNLSLEHAAGDWILVLDADEAIAERDHDRVRAHLKDTSKTYTFVQRHYQIDNRAAEFHLCKGEYPEWERHYGGYSEGRLCRLFPNHRKLYFVGKIYEFVETTILRTPGLSIVPSPVPIHHYGHTPEVLSRKKKYHLYAKLLQEKAETQDDWRSWYEYASSLFSTGKLEPSRTAFQRAYERRPEELAVLKNYGAVLTLLGERESAIDIFNQALAINHAHPELHNSIAKIYVQIGRPIFAEAHFRRAIELHPQYVDAFSGLGRLLISLHRVEEAQGFLRQALELQPYCVDAALDLAATFDILGDNEEACRLLMKLPKTRPLSPREFAIGQHILSKAKKQPPDST